MPKFVIERDMPGAGNLSTEELHGAAKASCDALRSLGSEIQWVESYQTADKFFCVYLAPDKTLIEQHSQMSGFPVTNVYEVLRVVDPTLAEA